MRSTLELAADDTVPAPPADGTTVGISEGSRVGWPVGNGVTTPATTFVTLKALWPLGFTSRVKALKKAVLLRTDVTLVNKSAADVPPLTCRKPSCRVNVTDHVTPLLDSDLHALPALPIVLFVLPSLLLLLLPSPRRRRRLAELVMLKAVS